VPDTKDIIPLLSEMQSSHDQMVIVVDEYGGTAGIITIEDIVEEVVGEIADEFDPDNKYITQLSEREWLVDGRFSINDAIELGWPIKDSDEYETIAGFVLELADSVPPLPRPEQLIAATCPADEMAEHEKFIAMIDKKCKTGSVWTRVHTPPAPADEQKA
jgi:Mg2+/Co2+ transporter CorC